MSNLSAILPYFGGKRTLAPKIVQLLTEGRTIRRYVEPFHGSLAVLLALRDSGFKGAAIVNDLNGHVHNLAMCLASYTHSFSLFERLSIVPFSENSYRYATNCLAAYSEHGNSLDVPNGETAAQYFVASWMGRNGETGTDAEADFRKMARCFCCRFTTSGGDPALRWRNAVESIPAWFKTLSDRTQYLSRDALDVVDSTPDGPDLAIYLDPPYLAETRGSARYAVDVEDGTGTLAEGDDFHARLRERLEKFREARVVVSYYDHERLDRLYAGWTKHTIEVAKNTAQSARGASKRAATEVLFVR